MVDRSSVTVLEVQSNQFVSQDLPEIVINHFLCKICGLIVVLPKECPKCASLYCFECNQAKIS